MKNVKTFVAGTLVGAMLTGLPVMADTVKKMIEVELNTINVTVDGQKVEGDNILYNDRTYVPLRTMAEMIGKEVSWDEKTNTANIKDGHGVMYTGEVVGTVDGENITSEQLDVYKSLVKNENKNLSDEETLKLAKEAIIHDVALEKLAAKYDVYVDENFDNLYNSYMQYLASQIPEITQALQSMGYTEKSYKQTYQSDYLRNFIMKNAPVEFNATEEEVLKYYNENKEDYKYDGVRAKHILLSTLDAEGKELADDDKKAVEKKAQEVYAKAKKGEDFDKLIEEYGEDEGMKQNPDGYVFTKGEMVESFEKAAFALKAGEISEVVESEYGYHIIMLMEKLDYQPLETAKGTINQFIGMDKVDTVVTDLEKLLVSSWK